MTTTAEHLDALHPSCPRCGDNLRPITRITYTEPATETSRYICDGCLADITVTAVIP